MWWQAWVTANQIRIRESAMSIRNDHIRQHHRQRGDEGEFGTLIEMFAELFRRYPRRSARGLAAEFVGYIRKGQISVRDDAGEIVAPGDLGDLIIDDEGDIAFRRK
jgi:hypothetical protein